MHIHFYQWLHVHHDHYHHHHSDHHPRQSHSCCRVTSLSVWPSCSHIPPTLMQPLTSSSPFPSSSSILKDPKLLATFLACNNTFIYGVDWTWEPSWKSIAIIGFGGQGLKFFPSPSIVRMGLDSIHWWQCNLWRVWWSSGVHRSFFSWHVMSQWEGGLLRPEWPSQMTQNNLCLSSTCVLCKCQTCVTRKATPEKYMIFFWRGSNPCPNGLWHFFREVYPIQTNVWQYQARPWAVRFPNCQ